MLHIVVALVGEFGWLSKKLGQFAKEMQWDTRDEKHNEVSRDN